MYKATSHSNCGCKYARDTHCSTKDYFCCINKVNGVYPQKHELTPVININLSLWHANWQDFMNKESGWELIPSYDLSESTIGNLDARSVQVAQTCCSAWLYTDRSADSSLWFSIPTVISRESYVCVWVCSVSHYIMYWYYLPRMTSYSDWMAYAYSVLRDVPPYTTASELGNRSWHIQ